MEVTEVDTNKGHRSIICEGYRYRLDNILKSDAVSWRCTMKGCKARLRTDTSAKTVLQQKNEHSHEPDERKNERHVLRNSVKRKASDDISQRPSKHIRKALQEQEEEQLEPKDLKRAAKAIYRRRRKTYPPLPKSLAKTHEVLPKMNIQTNKFEDFLQINDIEKGMIMYTCQKNLECLSDVSELFMDGTYKCCPKFFQQLYTIHGLRNGHYVPLVFVLLSGKSECVYNHCLTSLVVQCF